ncbi:MAG TPA: hypothetical protein VHE83_04010 [Mycobacteriales bacterium]|nr:hypothetical protein [Mycobacteriales bacterium]
MLSGRRRRWGAPAVLTAALTAGLASALPAAPAISTAAAKEFHGYSIAYQTGDRFTGVRGRFRDFAPTYPLDPTDHSDDVNGAIWIILGSGTSLEIGYTVLAVGEPGTFQAYRYLEINQPNGHQQIVAMDQAGNVTTADAGNTGVYDTFPADTTSHDYAIVRERLNPHVWDFLLDGHVVYRCTTGRVETGRTLEAGIESYHPQADVLDTFGSLGKQRNGHWIAWTHQDVRVGKPHLSGYWTGPTAWTASEHA